MFMLDDSSVFMLKCVVPYESFMFSLECVMVDESSVFMLKRVMRFTNR